MRKAAGYSLSGLGAVWRDERAFQEELALAAILVPLALYISGGFGDFVMLVSPIILLLVAEIINSAIEAAIDLNTTEIHPLAKKAKDAGSAAVLVCLIWLCAVWGGFFYYMP